MRVALVAPLVTAIAEPQLGGSQALLADIATGLAARGHDVAVFAATGSSIAGVEVVDTGIDPDALQATRFRAQAGTGEHGASVADDAFASVYRQVAGRSFDILHNHAFDAPAIAHAPRDVRVVHTLHLPPRRDIADALVTARAHGKLTVAAVSRFGAASWQRLLEVDVVLPNGVPVDRIPFGDGHGGRLLYAGRLTPEKGVVEAIEIARRAELPITVIGDAYDERYAAEDVLPRAAGDVEIRPALPRDELWRWMGASAAVLCPALWDEPFGLVAAEAQAAGTPVIAFARGALGEVIRDGRTGALVTDVVEAAEALTTLTAYPRDVCRTHAETALSLERTLDAHEALYARLVGAAVQR